MMWTFGGALTKAEVSETSETSEGPIATQLLAMFGALVFVTAGTSVALIGIVNLAKIAGVPEYAISFFWTSIGAALPELIFDITAVRRRAWGLAIGDAFGSAFENSALTLDIGPLVAPTDIDTDLAIRGGIGALLAVGLVLAVFWGRRRIDRAVGVLFVLAYVALYPLVLAT
jgi:cation:H+ antiporter